MNTDGFSQRILKMQGSSTLKAALAATKLREQGFDVIDLTVGEPDFDTPEFIKSYANEGLAKGITKYTPSAGLTRFKEAIADHYNRRYGANLAPNQIAASCGGKQGLFNAITTIIDEGDEVLLPKPYWVTFPEIVNFCGGKNVFIETEQTGFVLSADQVKDSITDRTKLLVINSPSNPSGRVVPGEEMRKIFDLCGEKGIRVITDECYLLFVYPPAETFTAASLPSEYLDFICVSGSFSKTYAMTGWRIGYTITNDAWTKQMVKLQSHSATHPTSFVQYACAKAMENDKESFAAVDEMLSEYRKRRDWFIPALNGVDGIKCAMPEGAFYAFIDVRDHLGEKYPTSEDFGQAFLEESAVVTTDGTGFGSPGFIRLSYANSMENLERAVEKLREFVS
ncbi:MAG: pyridoxal phosphate-dependent aminotransferase [Pyrinomonadaceae bacterium]|nr:pyridoxal phosphate-dependent aminotransferase [Pyrinomonadaceae bacterium]